MTHSVTGSDRPAQSAPSRTQRLDNLPFTKKHRRLLVGSGVGWALDAMDVGLVSFIMAALAVQWELDKGTLSLIGSIGFVGMAIGATLGGLIADRIGRRQVFAITLLIYGLATGLSALSTGVAMLLILRFIVGLGLGAELPVASTLVSEYAPRRIRGRVVVLLEAFWAAGWIGAALISRFVIPASDDGWRWALAIGVLPAIYAAVVRFGLPESVRFLESKDRHDEAETIVRDFEAAAVAEKNYQADSAAVITQQEDRADGALDPDNDDIPAASGLWSAALRRRTLGLWIVWLCINFSYYGAFIWIPSILVAQGFSLVKSFEFTLIMTLAQLPGYAVSAWLIEKWGRRSTLATFLVGSALAAGAYGFAESAPVIITAGICLSFFNLGAWGALYAIGPELYPTRLRGSGTGAAAGIGRLAAIAAPLTVPLLLGAGGEVLTFGVFAAAFFLAAAVVFLLPEQRGRVLPGEGD